MLLVGLGNPGNSYSKTRHNAGFMLIEAIAEAYSFPSFKTQANGFVSKGKVAEKDLILLQPQTYMNVSGPCVQAVARFYKVPPAQIFVAHDELDIAPAKVKYKLGGGDAGHNGLKSITLALGTPAYHRLRLGIGRPTTQQPVEDYVLQAFTAPEREALDALIAKLVKALPDLLENPIDTLAKLGNSAA